MGKLPVRLCPTLGQNGQPRLGTGLWDSGELARATGTADPILNRLALVTKVRRDGTLKHRLVWDLRRSGVNSLVRHGERIVIPRVLDVIQDLSDLQGTLSGKERACSSAGQT